MNEEDTNRYEELDDDYDMAPAKKSGKPVNNRMGTLNRQQGVINRYRKQGLLN